MAAFFNYTTTRRLPVLLLLILIIMTLSVITTSIAAFEFQVGDDHSIHGGGWVVPPANDSKIYNDWASENRFRVGDTIHFRYRKDSVMEVSELEYKRCNSTHPNFFSNTGNTVYKLDRSGPFYFISGAAGHCQRGQRMIVKVMSHDDVYSPTSGSSTPLSAGSTAAVLSCGGVIVAAHFALSYINN